MSLDAMKQALEAWQTSVYGSERHHKAMLFAMTKIGQAIEQAERQEPTPAMIQALTEQYDSDRAMGIGFNPQTLCRAMLDARGRA